MDDVNETRLGKKPQEEPPVRQIVEDGNALQTDNVPDHFKVLVNSTIVDRWRSIQTNNLNPLDFTLECDLLCCVALTIALEEGFRLNELHQSHGFDLRVLRELTNLPPFRMPDNTYRFSLVLTKVLDLQFTMVIIPNGNDCCILNFMAVVKNPENDTIMLSHPTSTGVPISSHIEAIDGVTAKISNLPTLVSLIRPVIHLVMQQVLADRKIELPKNLMGITEDTQLLIFRFLTIKDFLSMCAVNSYFNLHFRNHEWLWRHYMKRDFGKIMEDVDGNPPLRFGINKYKFLLTKSREKDVLKRTNEFIQGQRPSDGSWAQIW